jgi:hypothetical protein
MSKSTVPHFVHRHNRDGSYDSICPRCAATAASATVEADLADGERLHECNPALLMPRPCPLAQQPRVRLNRSPSNVEP